MTLKTNQIKIAGTGLTLVHSGGKSLQLCKMLPDADTNTDHFVLRTKEGDNDLCAMSFAARSAQRAIGDSLGTRFAFHGNWTAIKSKIATHNTVQHYNHLMKNPNASDKALVNAAVAVLGNKHTPQNIRDQALETVSTFADAAHVSTCVHLLIGAQNGHAHLTVNEQLSLLKVIAGVCNNSNQIAAVVLLMSKHENQKIAGQAVATLEAVMQREKS